MELRETVLTCAKLNHGARCDPWFCTPVDAYYLFCGVVTRACLALQKAAVLHYPCDVEVLRSEQLLPQRLMNVAAFAAGVQDQALGCGSLAQGSKKNHCGPQCLSRR